MKKIILFLLLSTATPCFSQGIIGALPKPVEKQKRFDTGLWAGAHWTAAAFDYATTGNSVSECRNYYGAWPQLNSRTLCQERNPLARPFIGSNPGATRLAIGFAAESFAVSSIRNKKARRILQIGLIGVHAYMGVKNLKAWH